MVLTCIKVPLAVAFDALRTYLEVAMVNLPTAKDLRVKIAEVEGERAAAAMKAHAAADAEKQAFRVDR